MTLIECFTQAHIDNIAACLRLKPEKVVFVGNAGKMAGPIARYEALFRKRKLNTAVDTRNADDKDFRDLRAVIYRLIMQTEECVIDLTGGEPSVALAIGAALADLDEEKRKKVRVERFDHQTDRVVDYLRGNSQKPANPIRLTVAEMVALHGGALLDDAYTLSADGERKNLDRLWRVVSGMPKQWNDAVALLKRFEKYGEKTGNGVRVDLDALYATAPDLRVKEQQVRELLEKLDREGVIADQSSRRALKYAYTSAFLRYCIQKQGNVLEIKSFLEGKAVRIEGKAAFHDCKMSAKIDWDGNVPKFQNAFSGTSNEIDVVFMRGTVPLFVSCKNGDVDMEELYKLHTVATRFGGPYARKMLIVSDTDRMNANTARALACRAWDMDIFMVPAAAELTADQWQEIFRIPFSHDPEKAKDAFLKTVQ